MDEFNKWYMTVHKQVTTDIIQYRDRDCLEQLCREAYEAGRDSVIKTEFVTVGKGGAPSPQ